MKKFDLKFNDKTMEKILNDIELCRFNEVRRILKIISLVNDNTVIAIDGDWGCGKTFFLKEIEYIIKNKDKRQTFQLEIEHSYNNVKEKYIDTKVLDNSIVLYYNAWENDLHIDPLQSLLLFLLNELDKNKDVIVSFSDFKKKLPENIFKILNGIGSSLLSRLNKKIEDISGINTKETIEGTLDIIKNINDMKTYKDLADSINTTNEIKDAINDTLHSVLKDDTRIIFMVDELDRCRPDYAVKLLETIKHFYNNDNITFVVGVNIKELESTIKRFYGENFDGYKYLHKFFDITTSIKKLDNRKYMSFALQNGYGHNMGEVEENFKTNFSTHNDDLIYMLDFVEIYNFSLRDINRYLLMYELIKPSIDYYSTEDAKENYAIRNFLVPLILALKIKNIDDTRAFANGKPDFSKLCSKINNEVVKKHEAELGQTLAGVISGHYKKFLNSGLYYEIVNLI